MLASRPLSEFVASCCSCALSLEQRAFVAELIELASTRLLHTATAALPADVSAVLLASKRFLECSLCALEHACAESLGAQRASALQIARRALASILALTLSDAEPDASDTFKRATSSKKKGFYFLVHHYSIVLLLSL